jgi:hypothetical protein
MVNRGAQQADREEAIRARAASGDPGAMRHLSSLERRRGSTAEAGVWLRKAATAGSRPAMLRVAAQLRRAGHVEEWGHWLCLADVARRGARPEDVPAAVREAANGLGELRSTFGLVSSTTIRRSWVRLLLWCAATSAVLAALFVVLTGSELRYWVVQALLFFGLGIAVWVCAVELPRIARAVTTLARKRPQVWVFERGVVRRDRQTGGIQTFVWSASTLRCEVIRHESGGRYAGATFRYTLESPAGGVAAIDGETGIPSWTKIGEWWVDGEWWLLGETIAAAITLDRTGRNGEPRPPWEETEPVPDVLRVSRTSG